MLELQSILKVNTIRQFFYRPLLNPKEAELYCNYQHQGKLTVPNAGTVISIVGLKH
jgi:hypothetical protein